MKTFSRIVQVIIFSLIAGIVINQFHSQGMSWRTLILPAFSKYGLVETNMIIVSADSALVLFNNKSTIFIDVRKNEDFQIDHIPLAHNIPSSSIMRADFSDFDQVIFKNNVLLYDQEGDLERLKLISNVWPSQGEKRVYILFGGYLSWLQNQNPVEFDG